MKINKNISYNIASLEIFFQINGNFFQLIGTSEVIRGLGRLLRCYPVVLMSSDLNREDMICYFC